MSYKGKCDKHGPYFEKVCPSCPVGEVPEIKRNECNSTDKPPREWTLSASMTDQRMARPRQPRDKGIRVVDGDAYDKLQAEVERLTKDLDAMTDRAAINGKRAFELQDERDALAAQLEESRDLVQTLQTGNIHVIDDLQKCRTQLAEEVAHHDETMTNCLVANKRIERLEAQLAEANRDLSAHKEMCAQYSELVNCRKHIERLERALAYAKWECGENDESIFTHAQLNEIERLERGE